MSIRITSRVWDHSKADGEALLVLLAFADMANDLGEVMDDELPDALMRRAHHIDIPMAIATLVDMGELDPWTHGYRIRITP